MCKPLAAILRDGRSATVGTPTLPPFESIAYGSPRTMAKEPTYERPRERTVGLSPWAERAMRAIVEAVFARPGAREGHDGGVAPPPEERVTWVCREIDDFLSRVSARSYAVVILSLVAVSVIAPLFAKKLGTLASLPIEDRVRALERFEASGLAPALLAIKALTSVHYYEHPDAAREVGFDGACMIASVSERRAS